MAPETFTELVDTAEDGKEFDEKEQCFADEYSGFEATRGLEPERQAHFRREHCGQRRLAACFQGSGEHAFQRKPRRDRPGWIYPGTTILHSLWRELVLERDAPIFTHAGAVQPSFNAPGAGERGGIQYAGVSESLRLQEGAAHGAGERLSRLVSAERVFTLSHNHHY